MYNASYRIIWIIMTSATQKKGGQDYGDSQYNKQTVKKKIQKDDYFSMDDPYDLSERFLNLKHALKYIENPKIRGLEKNYFDLKGELKKEQENTS